jgi:hypothetical protein
MPLLTGIFFFGWGPKRSQLKGLGRFSRFFSGNFKYDSTEIMTKVVLLSFL